MKKVSILIMLLFTVSLLYGKVLEKIDLPENWEIKNVEIKDRYKIDNVTLSKYILQTIKTLDSEIMVEYLVFDSVFDMMNIFFKGLEDKKNIYIDVESRTLYIVEGNNGDRKNVLRFLRLPILEQIKIVFKDIENIEKLDLKILKERDLSNEEISSYSRQYSIDIVRAKEQVFKVKENIGISVIFFLCKSSNDANAAYKVARINNRSDIVSFLLTQNFLIRLQWIKLE